MEWVDREKSRCVKAWRAAVSKLSGVNSVAFPNTGDYFVTATAGDLPTIFTNVIPHEMLAEAMIEWIVIEGWQDLPFDQLAETIERKLGSYPQQVLDLIAEMEIVLVQSRVEGLETSQRRQVVPLGNVLEPVTA